MPIRPEKRARYPKNWPEISRRVRARARGSCEWCGRPERDGVVLAAIHIDHDAQNNQGDNLAAVCQRCHLAWDQDQHLATRRATYSPKTKTLFDHDHDCDESPHGARPRHRQRRQRTRFVWVLCRRHNFETRRWETVWRPGIWRSTIERGPYVGLCRVQVFWRDKKSRTVRIFADDLEPTATLAPPPRRRARAQLHELPVSP